MIDSPQKRLRVCPALGGAARHKHKQNQPGEAGAVAGRRLLAPGIEPRLFAAARDLLPFGLGEHSLAGPGAIRVGHSPLQGHRRLIRPEVQGKGIGARLLQALIDTSTAKGYRLMVAVIGDSRNFASIALHRSAGFTFCGTIHSVGYKFGRWLDSVIMELPLGEGDGSAPAEIGGHGIR